MSTLSVPLTPTIELSIDQMVRSGIADSKAGFVRKAIVQYIEDQAVLEVLAAEQEVKEGKILRGDLDALAASL